MGCAHHTTSHTATLPYTPQAVAALQAALLYGGGLAWLGRSGLQHAREGGRRVAGLEGGAGAAARAGLGMAFTDEGARVERAAAERLRGL